MQKQDLIEKISSKSYSEKDEVGKFLTALTSTIADDLHQNGKTMLSGLGTFKVKQREEKLTRHPQNPNKLWRIPQRKAVIFTPGTGIKDIVRQPKDSSDKTPIPKESPAKTKEKDTSSELPSFQHAADNKDANIDNEIEKIAQGSNTQDILSFRSPAPTEKTDQKEETKKPDAPPAGEKKKTSPIPQTDLSDKTITKELLQKVPEYAAQLYRAVPVEEKGGKLVIAMEDPEDFQAISFIRKTVGSDISIVMASSKDIDHVLNQYSALQTKVEKVISTSELKKEEVHGAKAEEIEEDTPISRIVNSILKNAVGSEASDIHIEPTEKDLLVRFRVDGVLQKTLTLPKKIQAAVISRIKILSNMKIDEQRLPQDGRFEISGDRPVDFRVSTFPTVFGEKVVMRLLDKSQGILSLEDLGLSGRPLDILEDGIHKSHGMTLVCGPTGSGKTTTLYAVLDELNQVGVNIITLEDPVEYQIPGIYQGQIRSDIGFTFASGLRSIVRQDPDIIMVGEIRDLETAELAVQAALTGHIVLSTLHTNDAAGAIPRLIDMGVEPFLIASAINTIVAQRLARKICTSCKEEVKIDPKILDEIKEIIANMPEKERMEISKKPLRFFHGKGCDKCNKTGYKKRIGIFEILQVSENIKQLAIQKVSSSQITKQARNEGMVSMKEDGVIKAFSGVTSIEEVWRVTKE